MKVLVIGDRHEELDQLADQLTRLGIGFTNLRGRTDVPDRDDVVHQFRTDPALSVLLATKVAERGLNLQFCRILISLGLPENPARLAQQQGPIVRQGSPYSEVQHYVILANCRFDREAAARIMAKEEQAAMFLPDNHLPTPGMVVAQWWEDDSAA